MAKGTQYSRGRRKEWDVVKRLKAQGWRAQRSAGSHGLWDVVAVMAHQPVKLIQAKYTKTGAWADENTKLLRELAMQLDVPTDCEVWVYTFGRAEPDIWAPVPTGWAQIL